MKTMIGVMGSVSGFDAAASAAAYALGRAIARADCVTVTGACPGLPYDAIRGAKEAGGLTVGVSPGHNFAEHTVKYASPSEGFDVIIYTGSGLMGREITGVRSCDIVIVAGGRSGTLGEFAIAYDEGKLIGVLLGTGGLSDHVETLVTVINKETGAQIVYDADPERLVANLLELQHARRDIPANHHEPATEVLCALDDIDRAIAQMEGESRRIAANIAELRKRQEAYQDVALLGSGEAAG
jgi:uncharacterized protein (TIGR00725 family)